MNLPRTCLVISLLAVSVGRSPFLQAAPETGAPAWFKDCAASWKPNWSRSTAKPSAPGCSAGSGRSARFWEPADGDATVFEEFVRR